MRPGNVLLFLISVLAILFFVSLLFPEDGIKINDELTLHFLTAGELFGEDTATYADISDILASSNAIHDSVLLAELNFVADTAMEGFDTVRANADSLKTTVYPIEYGPGGRTVLYPVFRQLRRLKSSGQLIRILHYDIPQKSGCSSQEPLEMYPPMNQFTPSCVTL